MKRRNFVLLVITAMTVMSMLSTSSYIHAGKNLKKGKTEMASLEGMQMDAKNSEWNSYGRGFKHYIRRNSSASIS